jgi:hypothetical protein
MASQIIIGRFGLDIETSEVETWDMGGDQVQVSSLCFCANVATALAARQQILGLANNPDEPVVPVVWVEDDSLTGFYEVVSSRVETSEMTLTEGLLPWSATLRRLRGSASMITEQIIGGGYRDGAALVLTPRFWAAASSLSNWSSSTGLPTSATGIRSYYDATSVVPFDILEDATLADATVTNYAPPTDHYAGAVTLRMGDTLFAVVGRQTPNETMGWEIDNRFVKVTNAGNANDLCDIEFYPPSGTDLPTVTYTLRTGAFSGAWADVSLVPQVVTCTRNAREEVAIRIQGTTLTVDVTVRRGDRGAIFTVRGPSARHGIGFDTTTACTNIDASNKGVYLTTPDADDNVPILVASGAVTRDTTNGRVYRTTNGTSVQVYAGGSYDSAAVPDTPVWLQEAFFAAMGEVARVVSVS